MANLCLWFALFVTILLPSVWTENYACPKLCICLRTFVDCTKIGISEVPQNLPYWVENLELHNNNIKNLRVDDFQSLQELKYLDLSSNQLDENSTAAVLRTLKTLTTLKLNKNQLTFVPKLDGLNDLTTLSLSHNELQSLNSDILVGLPLLQDLDLSINKLTELHPGVFPNNSAPLKHLNLNGNRLSHLHKGSLDNLINLLRLQLNRNRLHKFPKDLFKELKQLKVLELNRNHFKEIEGLSFLGLENLTTMKLKHNSIAELLDGAFYELKNMDTLQLDYNSISAVTKGWLYGLSSLQTLSLTHNQVNHIEVDGWEFCSELTELDLSHNQLEIIEKGTFDHLPKLKRLILSFNKISNIAEGAFNSTPSLEVLELNGNEISWTIEDMTGAFMNLHKLTTLNLASNSMKTINKKAFMGLVSLKHLDLHNNSLTSIQENSFSSMHQLTELHINSSSLLCDCNLKWLSGWLIRSGFVDTVTAKCAHPQWLHNKLVTQIPSSNFTCDDFPKPRLIEEPKKKVAIKGENVTLTCRATSSSEDPMTFQWKKDNIDLLNSGLLEFARSMDDKSSEYKSELQLFNISHNEAGRYQCVVSNGYGTTYSQKAKISVLIFPNFTKTPGNLTLKSGSTAKLECAAEGEPKPQIAWQKDGGNDFPAARERRMHVIPADVIFFIVKVKPVDTGVYSCTAQNEAGKIVTNVTLTVLETPTFVKPMENKEISAGESTVLECMAAGSPKPKLRWTKDGLPLVPTPRHFFTAENQLLIIVNTALSDSGNYQCEMSNTLGTERGSSRLTIIPLFPGSNSNNGSITGYIIISVVCCAVLTSFCWVVIIYQSRKRSRFSAAEEFDPPEPENNYVKASSQYLDTNSDHSSDKDSGTGESVKRSSDDLRPHQDHFPLINNKMPDGSTGSIVEESPTLSTFHPHHTNHERCGSVQDEITPCIPPLSGAN